MASDNASNNIEFPKTPVPHQEFIPYINKTQGKTVPELVKPFNQYEAKLRECFAQFPDHQVLNDPCVNAVPIFRDESEVLRIQPRKVDDETLAQDYIMPLEAKRRKPEGAPATVGSMKDFKTNFNLFSESSLVDLDWTNVVAAGSSVVTPLLPVPDEYRQSKKAQREYYHQKLAPSSDVDLFIWGLDEAAAIEKIKQIESSVRNAILEEVTVSALNLREVGPSHYPVRHVQIVLRLYKSISEILTGFDVDCSCFAYDGRQVYGSPRGIASFITQTNTIDLTRRSPSYESRLSKYAHRGFEVYWPDLDRSRIDPTIFERSFARTMGLARLLVLEQLPKPNDRVEYLEQRRQERARPSFNPYFRRSHNLPGNFKDQDPDDVAEWVYDDAVSNYHSFTVPYGPKYHAKKIEKLLYTKDLLLNAEWNQDKDRKVNLHRHPCFVGDVETILHDCCGYCSKPRTDEEREVAEEESKIYVSQDLEFMKDDPGRQSIGSFNPITTNDWTDMAYIGNTQELCQRIQDGDLGFVESWCRSHRESIDRRDHTGRTPLHVAAQCSTPKVLKCLVDHGARIVARLVDGMTALHIAAARGSEELVTILLEKSEENEASEDEKEDKRRAKKEASQPGEFKTSDGSKESGSESDEASDEAVDEVSSDEDTTMTEGSFVKIREKSSTGEEALDGEEDKHEPDIYDINVVAWDAAVSPLHLAILGGHTKVINVLVSTFGADVLLPVKLQDAYSRGPKAAIMTLLLAANVAGATSYDVSKSLLSLGASSAQADMNHVSVVHYLAAQRNIRVLKACFEEDTAATKSVLDHVKVRASYWNPDAHTPLSTAIERGDSDLVRLLLDYGAKPVIDIDDFAPAYAKAQEQYSYRTYDEKEAVKKWKEKIEQPVLLAVENDLPDVVLQMIDLGVDINTLDCQAHVAIDTYEEYNKGHLYGSSLLDAVNSKIRNIEKAIEGDLGLPDPIKLSSDESYLQDMTAGSYEHWYVSKCLETAKNILKDWEECKAKKVEENSERRGRQQQAEALNAMKSRYVNLQQQLSKRGAKNLDQLYPHIERKQEDEISSPKKDKHFEPKASFRISGSEKVYDGYLQLFQAAWDGNLARIKELTLGSWGPDKQYAPLHVTTRDGKGFSPFTIAVYRQHLAAAKLILEIANAQFRDPEERPKKRYALMDEGSEYDFEDTDSDDLGLSAKIVDNNYTIDNVAELKKSVASKVSASEMLSKGCEIWCFFNEPEKAALKRLELADPYDSVERYIRQNMSPSEMFNYLYSSCGPPTAHLGLYAIASKNLDLLNFWLQCCKEATKMKQDGGVEQFLGFDAKEVDFALKNGHIEALAQLIGYAGAELPLDAMVKQSGIEDTEKPRYYQGLSIRGRKMTAWAREHRERGYNTASSEKIPFLLQAAKAANLPAVEWFLSDTPFRLYREFGANNKDDPRLKTLAKAHGGFEQAVSSWLKFKDGLVLYAAIASKADGKRALEVLKYLIGVFPNTVSAPIVATWANSITPLAFSITRGHLMAARALIDAGADQTCRDSTGKNLIHYALHHIGGQDKPDTRFLRDLLGLIDKRLLPSMFTERCRDGPGGLTPLAYWLDYPHYKNNRYSTRRDFRFYNFKHKAIRATVSTMLDFDGAEAALYMMDGSGQFPLHQAIKALCHPLVELLLERDPSLLDRENAMGQTPLELAHALYVRECTQGNPDIDVRTYEPMDKRRPEDFVGKSVDYLDNYDGCIARREEELG
ncbi:MAG: hypothetical protein Q9167_003849, partial [Letrouitia subvulpina]